MANPSQPRDDQGRFVSVEQHHREQGGRTEQRRGRLVERLDPGVRAALQRHVNDRAR